MRRLLIIGMAVLGLVIPATALAVAGSKFQDFVNHGCSDRVNASAGTAIIACGSGHWTIIGAKTTNNGISYRGTTLKKGQVYRSAAYPGYLLVKVLSGQHVTIVRTD